MIGERIALLRRGKGWSQSELAARLHISPSAVGMYEQGRREPSLEALVGLSQTFEVSADYLLTGKPLSEADSRAMQALLHNIKPQGKGRFSSEELSVLFAAMLTET